MRGSHRQGSGSPKVRCWRQAGGRFGAGRRPSGSRGRAAMGRATASTSSIAIRVARVFTGNVLCPAASEGCRRATGPVSDSGCRNAMPDSLTAADWRQWLVRCDRRTRTTSLRCPEPGARSLKRAHRSIPVRIRHLLAHSRSPTGSAAGPPERSEPVSPDPSAWSQHPPQRVG